MNEAELGRELAPAFAAEASEYVAQLNRALLELEAGPVDDRRGELLDELRRTSHTLKGSAGFTPFRDIVERAHAIESDLESIACGTAERTAFDAIYGHLDAVMRSLERGTAVSPVPAADAAAEESVRVPTRKLDALMSLIGEILVARVRSDERIAEIRELRARLNELSEAWSAFRPVTRTVPGRAMRAAERKERVDQLLRDSSHGVATLQRELERDAMHMLILTDSLQNEIKRVRMQPIGMLFDGFRRTVRDLAMRHARQVQVVVEGESAEVDKKILEELRDPLLHLIRNAIDHGFEPPEQRIAAGKAIEGTLMLRATTRAQSIVVEVEDDGRGLDDGAIRRTAAARGLIDDRTAGGDELADLVFLPGFSTKTEVGELSGRGVGLDAVRERVERLEGEITVSSRPGSGTTFALTLPVTLSTSRGLLLRAGGELWALPFSGIQRIVRIARSAVTSVDGHDAVEIDGRPVGLIRLATTLGFDAVAPASADKVPVVVLARGREQLAVAIDALVGEQEMVVKGLGPHLRRVPFIAGAALLGTGNVVAVLNTADLFAARATSAPERPMPLRQAGEERGKILVVDDSITTRTLEKGILETAGYRVRTARDGAEALEMLAREIDDAVISDVDMPRMNGLALVREIRSRTELRDVPVILVTSLGSEKDRRAGLDSGANAYIVKTEFDQNGFLETLASVIG